MLLVAGQPGTEVELSPAGRVLPPRHRRARSRR